MPRPYEVVPTKRFLKEKEKLKNTRYWKKIEEELEKVIPYIRDKTCGELSRREKSYRYHPLQKNRSIFNLHILHDHVLLFSYDEAMFKVYLDSIGTHSSTGISS